MKFVGREAELTKLMRAWGKTQHGHPQLVILLADSGYGKTRIIHEFYHQVSTQFDPKSYWPDDLGSIEKTGEETSLNVNPTFPLGKAIDTEIPWLWWGLRWTPEQRNNVNIKIMNNFDRLIPHFEPILKSRDNDQVVKKVLLKVGSVFCGLMGLGNLELAAAAGGLVKEIFSNHKKHAKDSSFNEDRNKEKRKPIEDVLDLFRVALSKKNKEMEGLPFILFLDDAQWIDETGIELVKRLLVEATANNWPLMVIATHWHKEWNLSSTEKTNLNGLVNDLQTKGSGWVIPANWSPLSLGKLQETNEVLLAELPMLSDEVNTKIINQVDGNPLYLQQIILELISDSDHFEGATKDSPLSEYGLEELDEIMQTDLHQLFKKRFKRLGADKRYLLGLGSIQGHSFFDPVIARMAYLDKGQETSETEQKVLISDISYPENITSKSNQEMLSEFKHKLFYDLARSKLKDKEIKTKELICVSLDWLSSEKSQKESNAREIYFLIDWVVNETESMDSDFLSEKQLITLGDICHKQAWIVASASGFTEAEPLFLRELAIREATLEENHPNVESSLMGLLGTYVVDGEHAKAVPMLLRVLAIREATLEESHPDVESIIYTLAVTYEKQGEYTKAESLYLRLVDICKAKETHSSVASSLNYLISFYQKQGEHVKAESYYPGILAAREAELKEYNSDVASGLNDLASRYKEQGEHVKAELFYQRVLAIREATLGENHPDVEASLSDLAVFYQEQNEPVKAKPLLLRAQAIVEATLGKNHPKLIVILYNLAEIYHAQGEYAEAEPLYMRQVAIREAALGEKQPNEVSGLDYLAERYHDQGLYSKAEHFYRRVLAIEEATLGENHLDVAGTLFNLAEIYHTQGKYAKAELFYQRTLAIEEAALGGSHTDLTSTLNGLAWHYQAQREYAKAESLYMRVMAIHKVMGEEDSPGVAGFFYNLAELYHAQGENAKAEIFYAKAEPFYLRTPDTMESA